VPGSPMDPRAAGPNDLLRHGATLTESVTDITDVLGDLLRRPLAEGKRADFRGLQPVEPDASEMDQARAVVAEALGPAPVTVDEIIRQCQLSPSMVSWVLLEVELAGRLERHPGNRVSLLVG
jgi:DNA processing protein